MKIGDTNLEVILNKNDNSSKFYLLENNNIQPIKSDEIKIRKTTNLIPAQVINLNSKKELNNKENTTLIDVALGIKEQFDTVPMDKKIYLIDGILTLTSAPDVTKLTTNYMMINERKKKIDKSIEQNNPKETLAQTIFTAKNTWAVINNSVKLANYIAEEAYSFGKISKSKLSYFEKGTNKVSNINNALVFPFAIADLVYSYDSMNSYKKEIDSSKNVTEKQAKIMKDNYTAKKVTFGLSALSLGALTSSLIFKSSNATTVMFLADIAQKFSKSLEDEKTRQSLKNSYYIIRAKI
ncbi:MAG: hypothetical protein KatS3mg068_2161 [Candidatus Sericytochromatia bacterium]|nr:MAG: hypothetical protein KatS3mg068_2161 [Candidatus Sericytochromatia bacterium]